MYFIRGLTRNDEPHPIWLPPPTQSEKTPNQNWWRLGDLSLNVACLPCKHVYEYKVEDSLWYPVQSKVQLEACENLAIYLLFVPCDVELCGGLIEILVVANRDEPPSADSEIVTSLFAKGVVCRNEHRTTFELASKSSRVLKEYKDFWLAK